MKRKPNVYLNKFIGLKFVLAICLLFSPLILQGQTIKLNYENVSLDTALKSIAKQTNYKFVYSRSVIDVDQKVSVNISNQDIAIILDELFKDTNIAYRIIDKQIALSLKTEGESVKAQQTKAGSNRVISGLVTDQDSNPLIGANVYVKGGTSGTFTDIDGRYSIEVKNDPNLKLAFKYLGMEEKIVVIGTRTKIDMTLDDDILALQQVIVTGYQTISRERAVGSFDIVSGKDIENKTQSNIMERLEGMVAGLNNFGSTSDTGGSQLTIRGVSSLYANTKPLYVVDGMPYEGDINLINPGDVINVSVLKDATANSIYGAQAANGVIVITTRRGQSGGQVGKTYVKYSGSIKLSPKPDFGYLNLINSSEFIDLQVEGFNYNHASRNAKYAYNPVIDMLYEHEAGNLSTDELMNGLAPYRKLDNRKQIEDEFARTSVIHQHNVSVSGGNEKNTYLLSFNYYGDSPNQRESNNWRIGFNLKDDMKFNKWLQGDISVSANFSRNKQYTGADYQSLMSGYPSYYMIRDEAGEIQNFPASKSKEEQDRLLALGLFDESYSPITNFKESKSVNKSDYYRIQAGLKGNIIEGLTAELKFQIEKGGSEYRNEYSPTSKMVRSMINNAATYDKEKNLLTLNVPKGGQLSRNTSNHFSYTLRGQLNYVKDFDKHSIVALLGAERRLVQDRYNNDYYMGYDNQSLELGYFNPILLRKVNGSQSLGGTFNWDYKDYVKMRDIENRYVSFYANASYTYTGKYSLTGSIRIDQSNLFGTDPKYQYRPLWSLGAGWHMKHEDFMKDINWIDQLSLRLTYGISGNVAKDAGPYLQFYNQGVQYLTGESAIFPDNPANKELRWEKTATTNIGLDASFLNSRICFSFDFYNKNTTDLLGSRPVNPFSGWSSVLLNYGDMYNRGIELSLTTINVKHKNFTWNTNVNFSYNKNKLTNLTGAASYVSSYVTGGVAAKGYPLNSLFSYKFAGVHNVDNRGVALVYNKSGEKVKNVSEVEELVFSGTRDPRYTASLFNKFSIQNVDISFMFVYYGGHKLRDVTAPILSGAPSANIHKSILNRWQKPGDEYLDPKDPDKGLNPKTTPSFQYVGSNMASLPWSSADIHVKKADYIKLRDVTVSYRLPRKVTQKAKLEGVVLTFQVNDLLTWAANGDIDPEAYALNGMGMGDYAPKLTLRKPTTYTLGAVINF